MESITLKTPNRGRTNSARLQERLIYNSYLPVAVIRARLLQAPPFFWSKKQIEANTGPESQIKVPSADTTPAWIVHPANGKARSEHTPGWR